ncbi:MAG: hypothetical protein KME20_22760 [Kaiparowitsia implicata GSE-PSE-MK54-09C]|nr:hypothetical protein [Kaiparowitsia implicata GSE-PSE-MK54-09C]
MSAYVIDADDAELELWDEAIAPDYSELRKLLCPEYQTLSSDALEHLLTENLGVAFSPEDAESFLRSLGQVGAAVLPVAGTVVGTAIGGPLGGALGGAAGSVAGQALGAATAPRPAAPQPAAAPRPQPAPPRPQAAAPPPPRRAIAPPTAASPPRSVAPPSRQPRPATPTAPSQPVPSSGSPAAAQLLSTISQPQVLQALLALALGSAARQTVQVGEVPVPTAAIANLLGVLGTQAAQQAPGLDLAGTVTTSTGGAIPAYLIDAEGYLIADPVLPEGRATALYTLLQQANQEARSADEFEEDETEPGWSDHLDALYDALELADLYGEADCDGWEGC